MPKTITKNAYAKINLTLDVLGKRADGYHEVEMIMQQIDLYDVITVAIRPNDRNIVITSTDAFIPTNESNLAYRAAVLMQETYNLNVGFDIHIEKHIPVAAGLAGGSTDAAATMTAINDLLDLSRPKEALEALGTRIGADVPFCIRGGCAIARGIGEKLESIRGLEHTWLLLVKPSFGVSTKEVYTNLKIEEISEHPKTLSMVDALKEQSRVNVLRQLGNVLETSTLKLYPSVKTLKDQMKAYGADATLMSGSGPTVFGFYKNHKRTLNAYHNMKKYYPQSYVVMTYNGEKSHKGD